MWGLIGDCDRCGDAAHTADKSYCPAITPSDQHWPRISSQQATDRDDLALISTRVMVDRFLTKP
jgi:hypothetical protein